MSYGVLVDLNVPYKSTSHTPSAFTANGCRYRFIVTASSARSACQLGDSSVTAITTGAVASGPLTNSMVSIGSPRLGSTAR